MASRSSGFRLGLVASILVTALVVSSPAVASGLLAWSKSVRITHASLVGLSCPSRSLCVAEEPTGGFVVSTDPLAKRPRWRVVPASADSGLALTGIACPTTRLCVAIDSTGDVITSTNPSRRGSWATVKVDAGIGYLGSGPVLTGVSCPSRTLCVAVDYAGNAIVSTDPAGGASAWTLHPIDDGLDYECYHYGGTGPGCIPGLVGISCASRTTCAAIDWAGGILLTHNPIAPGGWGGGQQPASESYDAISCPSAHLCWLAQLYSGQVIRIRDGRTDNATVLEPSGSIIGIWCRPASICFASGTPNQSSSATQLFESINPGARHPRWTRTSTTPGATIAVSCPSTTICIAAIENGTVQIGAPRATHRH